MPFGRSILWNSPHHYTSFTSTSFSVEEYDNHDEVIDSVIGSGYLLINEIDLSEITSAVLPSVDLDIGILLARPIPFVAEPSIDEEVNSFAFLNCCAVD